MQTTLTSIEIDNLQGQTLPLPLQGDSLDYVLKEIEGLDPVKSTIVTSTFAQLDGSQFQGSRRENRNIVLKIGMEPYYGEKTVRELRNTLYGFFMPKSNVLIKVYLNNIFAMSIQGQVETFENPLFSKDPEANISIICFDPSFVSSNTATVNGNTTSSSVEQAIAYPGTVEVGYIFTLNVNRPLSSFSIYNRRPSGEMSVLDFAMHLEAGDIVNISTLMKDKYATLTRASVETSVMYAVSTTSKWGPLWPGNNYYRVAASGAPIPFKIAYSAKYGGL